MPPIASIERHSDGSTLPYDGGMPVQSSPRELGKGADPQITEQLGRILNGKAFRQADRLKRFLTFIVEETLAGRCDQLKEFVVGIEVFGKPESFDARNDPIVRVQARRLRAQLARYYREEGQDDSIVIDLPKGGYSPIFRHQREFRPRRQSAPSAVSRRTVAVFPFADHSAASDQKHFCAGLREEIIGALTNGEGVRLMASVGDLEAEHGLREGDRVKASIIVTGSVRVLGAEARVSAHLIDTSTRSYIWSGTVSGDLEKPFELQEEAARTIAEQLSPEALSARESAATARPAENLAAYNLYVQGRYYLNQRTEEGLRRAVELFDKAIVEDAQYSEAYSGLADAYSLLGHYGVLAPAEVWAKAASNAEWAVHEDDHSAEAHTSLAHVRATQNWDWAAAEREFQRAIALNSRYPTAHHWYAVSCLAPVGRLDEALREIETAEALDPISSIIARDVARVHYYRQDYDAALEQCDHTIELNPHFAQAYWTLGLVQEQRGDFDESAAAFHRALQLTPKSPIMQSALCRTAALSGKREEAARLLREMHELIEKRYVPPLELASCHFALGGIDEAFEWLAKAFQDHSFEVILVRIDPRWQGLRGNPRFEHLLKQLKLP